MPYRTSIYRAPAGLGLTPFKVAEKIDARYTDPAHLPADVLGPNMARLTLIPEKDAEQYREHHPDPDLP